MKHGNWESNGHRKGVVRVDEYCSKVVFVNLYDTKGSDYKEARLSRIHAENLVPVLEKFSDQIYS